MGLRLRAPALLGAAVIVIGLALASTALATPPPNHKVTICHATNSDTNPYVVIDVDIASSGYLKAGHSLHTGPIWYAGAKADKVKWGDIIPAYDYEATSFHFAGLNWTADGQAIWEAGCVIGEASPPASPEQSQAAETDQPSASPSVPSPSPSFLQSVAADTDAPTEPSTSTSAVPAASPADGAFGLAILLGIAVASLLFLTPHPARRTRG